MNRITLDGKDCSISNTIGSFIGTTTSINQMRLLILGYIALQHREDELATETGLIFRSLIYPEDILGITLKSSKAILRKSPTLLSNITVTVDDVEVQLLQEVILHKDHLELIWNQEIVHLLSERVNYLKHIISCLHTNTNIIQLQ